jgi:hypothetical protein
MTIQEELSALYLRVVKDLENNLKFIQDHKGTKSAWDMDIMNTLVISNRVLISERNDIGEILWHSGIDAQKLSISQEQKGKE